ncbi:MAG: right-handed parallel beta-helix repeat-containing protein, partial [Pedobacter sp.]
NVKADVNLVMRDGTIQQVGRYPNIDAANGGYITYTAATSSSVTGAGLALPTNWTGAEIAIRINRWDIVRQKVTAHSGTTVNFTTNPEVPRVNYGCFFQRDPRTLDKDGEWWYDATNQKLRMYFSGNNPAAFSSLQIATVDTLFLNQYGNISVTNIAFNGSGKKAVWNHGGTNVLIKDVDVNNSGAEAITGWFATNVTIDGCSVENSLGSGIRVWNTSVGPKNLIVKNCTVNKTCLIAGMETTNVMNGGVGILCKGGSNVRVFNNTIKNSGYNGIEWQGDTARVYNNLVENFCSVRDDGAGIYTVETGNNSAIPQRYDRKVTSNIVINGIGARFGTPINTKTNHTARLRQAKQLLTKPKSEFMQANFYSVKTRLNIVAAGL